MLNQRLHDVARGGEDEALADRRTEHTRSQPGWTPRSRSKSKGTSATTAPLNKVATVRVHRNAGPGLAENMMSGLVVVDGNASQSAGATGRGGLMVVHGDAAARCGISMKGIDLVVRGSVGHLSAFMAQTGRLVVCGDAGDAPGTRSAGPALRPRTGRGPRAGYVEGGPRRTPLRLLAEQAGIDNRIRRTSAATGRPGNSTTSTSTTRPRTDACRRKLGPPRVVPVRPHGDRRDSARRAQGDLRHPRFRGQAAAPP